MDKNKRSKAWIFKALLLLFSVLIALVVCEVALRILKPDLGELVNSEKQTDSYRIFANPISGWKLKKDPDAGTEHLAYYNAFGSRQHRDFTVAKPEGTTRIALCGDSYTVNSRMPAPYSFSEPLDYLFNESGNKVEVLNFGTGGYGTDQVYLQYKETTEELDLDVVLYVCCWNDYVDVVGNKLFELGENEQLQYVPRPNPSFVRRIARKFYLTYFVLSAIRGDRFQHHNEVAREYQRDRDSDVEDAVARKAEIKKAIYKELTSSPDGKLAERLTRALLTDWKRLAEERGQEFYLVLLPRDHEVYTVHRQIAADLGITVLDLHETISADAEDLEPLFFKTDLHWNAEGNKYGAVHLFKFLNEQLGWSSPGDEFVSQTLSDYYYSFDPDYVRDSWLIENYSGTPPETREQIRQRYVPLERPYDDREDIPKS